MAAATIQEHLHVAFRLLKRDATAVDDIANTQAAFWYSFLAALISLPFMLISVMVDSDAAPGVFAVLPEIAVFVVAWLLFPVVMLEIVPVIDRTQHYCRYIAASNWCSVLEDAVLTIVVLLRFLDIIPGTLGGVVFFACVVWVFSYQFFVARHGLKIDAGTAAMIIGVRLLLSLALFFAKSVVGG